jgi:hypothetical protein
VTRRPGLRGTALRPAGANLTPTGSRPGPPANREPHTSPSVRVRPPFRPLVRPLVRPSARPSVRPSARPCRKRAVESTAQQVSQSESISFLKKCWPFGSCK